MSTRDPFTECLEALKRDFPRMKYKDRVRFCREYAEIAPYLKLKPKA
jgi:hypothetical protein